jgi:PAS domain S-box-containing protein
LAAIALHNSHLLASLEESELRFRSVVETASAAIVTTDSQGRITFWNRMAETIFGYTAQEAIGAPLTRLSPSVSGRPTRRAWSGQSRRKRTRLAGETVETIGARKGGSEFPLEMSLATWKTGEASFFTLLMHDITQRKQSEEALGGQAVDRGTDRGFAAGYRRLGPRPERAALESGRRAHLWLERIRSVGSPLPARP